MWKKSAALVLLLALWIPLLWFALDVDFSAHSNFGLIELHVLPPLVLWCAGLVWLGARARKQAARAQAAEAAAREERDKRRAAARAEFEKELADRRTSIDCRWARATEVMCHGSREALALSAKSARLEALSAAPDSEDDRQSADWPKEALLRLLADLYRECSAATMFPIYVQGPTEYAVADHLRTVREARSAALAQLALDDAGAPGSPVLGMPQSAATPQELIDLLASQPELPGMLVLAFESPWRRSADDGDDFERSPVPPGEHVQWHGRPGQALVALLLTAPGLPPALVRVSSGDSSMNSGVMTPYWERMQPNAGLDAVLAGWPRERRAQIGALPVVAQLHRPAWFDLPDTRRPREMANVLRRILEEAGINAGLIDPQFDRAEGATTGDGSPPPSATLSQCGWLVHNAGGAEVAGSRLAAAGLALSEAGCDIDPINDAINSVVHVGDCGRAGPYLNLTLAITKAAGLRKPVLLCDFAGRQVAMSLVAPGSLAE